MHPVLWWFVLVCMVGGCTEPAAREYVAGALEVGAVGLDVAAVKVPPAPCAVLVGGAVALRGGATAARSRELPAVAIDLERCGEVPPAAVACEVQAWVLPASTWLSGVAGVVVDAAADPSGSYSAPAVAVGRCP